MEERPIRILLAEDHQVVREGLVRLLADIDDIRVVAEAADGIEAVELAERHGPDIVVIDVGLPGLNGLEATRRIVRTRPDIRVVALTMHDDATTVDRALRAGARGFVMKGHSIASLCEAIRVVHRGEVYLCPEVSDYVLQGYLHGDKVEPEPDPLTDREREVLQLVAEGYTSEEIAERTGLKPKTVRNYRTSIMDKLDIRTTAGLVRYALRHRIAT